MKSGLTRLAVIKKDIDGYEGRVEETNIIKWFSIDNNPRHIFLGWLKRICHVCVL